MEYENLRVEKSYPKWSITLMGEFRNRRGYVMVGRFSLMKVLQQYAPKNSEGEVSVVVTEFQCDAGSDMDTASSFAMLSGTNKTITGDRWLWVAKDRIQIYYINDRAGYPKKDIKRITKDSYSHFNGKFAFIRLDFYPNYQFSPSFKTYSNLIESSEHAN